MILAFSDLCPVQDERLDDLVVPLRDGLVEGSAAEAVSLLDGRAVAQEVPQHGHLKRFLWLGAVRSCCVFAL